MTSSAKRVITLADLCFGKCSPSPLSSTSPTLSSIRINHGAELAKHPGELQPLRRSGSGEITSALCAAAISVPHHVQTHVPLSKAVCNLLVTMSNRCLGKTFVALVLTVSLLRSGTSTFTQHTSTSQHEERSVADPVHSFWTSEPSPLDDLRSTDDLPTDADIVIIGAGFAGIVRLHHELVS